MEGGAYYNNTSPWWQEEPASLIAVLKAWVCTNNVEVMKNCSFCMNPGLCIPQSLCMCVTQVSPQFTSPSVLYTLCTAGQMCPGREPHKNNNKPHQTSSTKYDYETSFNDYKTSLYPSIPCCMRRRKGSFLDTSWSQTDLSFLVSLFLFKSKSKFIFYRYSSKYTQRYHLNDHIQTLRNPLDPPQHYKFS